jgi:hypothetical protein
MRLRIKYIVFPVLVLSLFASGYLWAANNSHPVEVNGDQLSVQADGIPLGELLIAVEDLTDIHFDSDELMAKRETFLDFKDLSLSEGIKKMVFPLNCAMIYDDTDRLRRVVILGNSSASGTIATQDGDSGLPERLQSSQPDTTFPGQKRRSDISAASKMPSAKGPVRYEGPPAGNADPGDEEQKLQGQGMEGPPLNKPYLIDGPPIQQDEVTNGPTDAVDPDHLPPSQSEKAPMDGPPSNRPYLVDGPPDSKEYEMEAPPGV